VGTLPTRTTSEVNPIVSESPWYRDGLRFACTQCGNCCGGGPGTIRASDAEISALAGRFGLTDEEFRARYTRRLRGGDISLIEKRNHDCIFFDRELGCTVYSDRPKQCRTWPFWQNVVFSRETWDEEARDCPGMNQGPLHPEQQIRSSAAEDGTLHLHRGPQPR
jgi:Fe-S-cluster containining protein